MTVSISSFILCADLAARHLHCQPLSSLKRSSKSSMVRKQASQCQGLQSISALEWGADYLMICVLQGGSAIGATIADEALAAMPAKTLLLQRVVPKATPLQCEQLLTIRDPNPNPRNLTDSTLRSARGFQIGALYSGS